MKRVAALGLLAVALAGCGGGSDAGPKTFAQTTSTDEAAQASQTFQLEAAQLSFNTRELKATAGQVQLVMTNGSSIDHNIAIKGNGVDVKGDVVGEGDQSTVTANLKPGEYEFYCSVDAHEQSGMRGTLRVRAPK